MIRYSLAVLLLAFTFVVKAQPSQKSDKKARQILKQSIELLSPKGEISFDFTSDLQSFGHLMRPFQTTESKVSGNFTISANDLFVMDSTQGRDRFIKSYTMLSDSLLFYIPYGRNKPSSLTKKDLVDERYESLKFSPLFLLNHIYSAKDLMLSTKRDGDNVIINTETDSKRISIRVSNKSKEVTGISILYPHEMFGDVLRIHTYKEYKLTDNKTKFASEVIVNELNTDLSSTRLSLSKNTNVKSIVTTQIPGNYKLADEVSERKEVVYTKYNEHIHLLELKHTDDRVLLVSFKDFLLIAEAPINTTNGELIIQKAKEIFPDKPIRYFVFGHHHPHYIGGLRAFVNNGTTILAIPDNESYISKIANSPHTLQPDALQQSPKPLKLELFTGEKIIADAEYEMRILHIGKTSTHTEDYLIYYFPKDELLFEDDLVWIKNQGTAPASPRQRGLYDGIINNNLKVKTIIQSWPVADYGVKTIFDFSELEASVQQNR